MWEEIMKGEQLELDLWDEEGDPNDQENNINEHDTDRSDRETK